MSRPEAMHACMVASVQSALWYSCGLQRQSPPPGPLYEPCTAIGGCRRRLLAVADVPRLWIGRTLPDTTHSYTQHKRGCSGEVARWTGSNILVNLTPRSSNVARSFLSLCVVHEETNEGIRKKGSRLCPRVSPESGVLCIWSTL